MLTKRIEVYVVDASRKTCQEIGKTQNCPLRCVEEFLVSTRARLTQCRNLLLGDASPLRRSGMCARSILATIDD